MVNPDSKTSARPASRRPSLLAGSGRSGAEESAHRMLASIECGNARADGTARGGSSPRRTGLWTALAALLGGLAVVVGLGVAGGDARMPADQPAARNEASAARAFAAAGAVRQAASDRAIRQESMARIEPAAATASAPVIAEAGLASGAPGAGQGATAFVAAASPVPQAGGPVPAGAPDAFGAHPQRRPAPRASGNPAQERTRRAEAAARQGAQATSRFAGGSHGAPGPQASARTAAPSQAPRTAARKPKDDADAELVAAIIARLDRRGSEPSGAARAGAPPADAAAALAGRVRRCSATADLVEARRCRNRACHGRWGRADACPSALAPRSLPRQAPHGG